MLHRHRAVTAAAIAVVLALTTSACGSSGYQYVKNSDKGLFFKIPASWAQFRVRVEDGERPDNIHTSRPWTVVVDGAAEPDATHFGSLETGSPTGQASVLSLVTGDPRDAISHKYLRSTVLDPQTGEAGGDPLQLISDGNPNIELVDYEEVTDRDEGFWGNHIVINLRVAEQWVTIGQTAMVDVGPDNLYRLVILCTSSCYDDHRREIDQIFESWTLENR